MADIKEIKTAKDIKGDDELYDPRKKREIIKTILIIFLAVLLVLTFFSNTIMNKSLAEISTERSTSGKLTERLRASGLVESNQSYDVTVDGNRTVDTIMVKQGQEVSKDDVLFTVGIGENDPLTAAEDELEQLELNYQKALLAPPADYSAENQAIKNAREDLAAAISKRDNAIANQGGVQAAKDNYNYNKSRLSYYTKLQSKLQLLISAADMDEYNSAPVEYTGEIVQLKSAYDNASADYDRAYSLYSELSAEGSGASEAERESARADMTAKEAAKIDAKSAYETAKFTLRSDASAQLANAESNVEWYQALIDEYESGNSGAEMTVDELNADVTAKQRALEDLITALNKTKTDNAASDKISSLDLEAMKKDIDKAKQKADKLKEETQTTEIRAKYSGVVSSVSIKPGEMTVPEMPVMTIDLSDEGYTVQVSVEAEKTKKIKTGTAAEVVNNWSGDIQAVLTDMKNDTAAGSKNRILVFSVTGNVDSGTYLDLSIPCGSGNYDSIVPKSAIFHDKDGDFVLTVTSKSSPLGNRYYADRVAVEVLASDEASSAVSGGLSNGEYVITAASKPVAPRDQVRMKDK